MPLKVPPLTAINKRAPKEELFLSYNKFNALLIISKTELKA